MDEWMDELRYESNTTRDSMYGDCSRLDQSQYLILTVAGTKVVLHDCIMINDGKWQVHIDAER